jgi:hypothetical protein
VTGPALPASDLRRPSTDDGPALAVDLVFVAVFVLLGRTSHREGGALGGYLTAAWPFLAGALAGWAAVALARRGGRELPGSSARAGVLVVAGTVIVGMLLRRTFTEGGTPLSFLVVATSFVTLFLLGWRIADRWRRARTGRR